MPTDTDQSPPDQPGPSPATVLASRFRVDDPAVRAALIALGLILAGTLVVAAANTARPSPPIAETPRWPTVTVHPVDTPTTTDPRVVDPEPIPPEPVEPPPVGASVTAAEPQPAPDQGQASPTTTVAQLPVGDLSVGDDLASTSEQIAARWAADPAATVVWFRALGEAFCASLAGLGPTPTRETVTGHAHAVYAADPAHQAVWPDVNRFVEAFGHVASFGGCGSVVLNAPPA